MTLRFLGQTFRIERDGQDENVVSSTGKVYHIVQEHVQGSLDLCTADAEAIRVAGWAVEPCLTRPALDIAVFVQDRFLGYGAAGVARPDVARHLKTASAQYAGFDFYLRCTSSKVTAAEFGHTRAFFLSQSGHAAELRRHRPSSDNS
jgi:hypothetical protein